MKLTLDTASTVPLYQQLVDGVRRLIAIGALRPGDRLPTVRELAEQLRLNRNTAARAIAELESQGVVRTRVGVGSFVSEANADQAPLTALSLLDAAIDRLYAEGAALRIPREQIAERVQERGLRRARSNGGRSHRGDRR